MSTKMITLNEAQTYLGALIAPLKAGEEIVIVHNKTPLAKLIAPTQAIVKTRTFDKYKGKIKMSDDFDAPLPEYCLGSLNK